MQNGDDTPTAMDNTKKVVPEEVTKHTFRLKVWRQLETNGLAMFPRPVYNRIPNFKGAPEAAAKLAELDIFKNANTVKVNPDKPQEPVRVMCLEQHKTLYVPVPRLHNGFLNQLELPDGETGPSALRKAVSRNGMESYGKPIGIGDSVSLDLVVMGSVAVSKEGYRIGKGRGYGDLEFGLMMHMKAINPDTVVATTVHDCQVFDTLPAELFGPHDVPIDFIVTPTQVIATQRMSQRPVGILWHLLSNRRLQLMPILGQLREIEMLAGRACPLKEVDTDVEERAAQRPRRIRRRTRSHKSQSEGEGNTTEGEDAKGKPRRTTRRRNSNKSTGKDKDGKDEKEQKPRRPKRQRPVIDFSLKYLQSLGAPHIDSFNYMLQHGLNAAIADLIPAQFELPTKERVKISIDEALFSKPNVPLDTVGVKHQRVLPTECRQRAVTYKADLKIRVTLTIDAKSVTVDRSMGSIPVMLKSKICHLADLSPEELVEHNEHADEWGGYFIIKGHERLARMLLVTRRNYPVAIKRSAWKMRGNFFSDYGVSIRCVTPDQTSANNVLHYLTNGMCKLMFSHRKMMYYAPLLLIMKCLVDWPDHYIYRLLLHGKKNDLYYVNCIQNMLRELHEEGLHSSEECLLYLGRMFRPKLFELPPWSTELEAAHFLLDRCVMIHLTDYKDKFYALVFMAQKLFDLAQNKCKVEGADAVMMQELLLGGHLYLQVLKERLQQFIINIKIHLLRKARLTKKVSIGPHELHAILRASGNLEQKMETFLATGNAPTNNVNLAQYKGLTIVAENINRMRFMSHFKSIHRGSFFMEMRTTEARQLLPDAWGFVCPVHTPDGAPCGLLNHLTMTAQVTPSPDSKKVAALPQVLEGCGMEPISSVTQTPLSEDVYKYPVFVDGRLVGYFSEDTVHKSAAHLRTLKVRGEEVPITTEIVVVPKKQICAQYAGVFLMTNEARMMRPVINLATGQLELIGTMEQLYLDIAVTHEQIGKGKTTHVELSPSAFLSNLAQLVPMPDCNQSPRNMYQCQMGKQTMGTPIHTWPTNAETKLYRLQTPATPLFRPVHHDNIGLDDFPCGTNGIVAVISYTGYDMEDAMIINKSAHERGFAAGSVYKSEFIELEHAGSYFCRDPGQPELGEHLDQDGLPPVGARVSPEDPLYCFFNAEKMTFQVCRYHGKEEVFVDSVRQCGDFTSKQRKKTCIMLRLQRNPTVGDKFASRAGQKGICSQKWPAEDLPFTESGLIPDIMFNPHGFPSRMTIAMMIECMAGKAACLHGHVHDATPFRFNERDTAIHYFGRLLEAGGYNYYGTERMYSGVDGREMTADIFFGVIHYQRLRHMVSDKWQVRTTGAVDARTRQPVKGRRRGGGVRLGEMERDALASHGATFMLHDRLLECSDKTQAVLCTTCGTLLGPIVGPAESGADTCRLCGGGRLASVAIPYIFKLFVTQLASVNINVKINCTQGLPVVQC